jgi:pyoverdine/dityrosine biosynthesis protein Dit1
MGFCLTHREKRHFYEFEPWLIDFNSITADINCKKAQKVVLFEEENGMRRKLRKNRQTRMKLMKRCSCETNRRSKNQRSNNHPGYN